MVKKAALRAIAARRVKRRRLPASDLANVSRRVWLSYFIVVLLLAWFKTLRARLNQLEVVEQKPLDLVRLVQQDMRDFVAMCLVESAAALGDLDDCAVTIAHHPSVSPDRHLNALNGFGRVHGLFLSLRVALCRATMSNINHANRIAREKMQSITKESVSRALSDTEALSERQLLFVTAVLDGKGKGEAARLAGYHGDTNGVAAWRSKKVQAAVAVLIDRFLVGEAATVAVRALYSIAGDERVAPGVRVAAANSLLDRAGFNAKRHETTGNGEPDISAMSAAELRSALSRIDAELTGRMVDVTPSSEPMTSDELDMYS